MTPEQLNYQRPYEVFGITEDEVTRWRISDERFKELISDPNTQIHSQRISSNNYGDFLFITTSKSTAQERICFTFWGLGYHEYRERWIHKEWFWYQTQESIVDLEAKLDKETILAQIGFRRNELSSEFRKTTQTETGRLFEANTDMADDDCAIVEMRDLGLL